MNKKEKLDKLIKKNKVQPVGDGYIDCIVSYKNVADFIDGLNTLQIKIGGLTWWCHCIENRRGGCPHGMDGPKSIYFQGWFSELDTPFVQFSNNDEALNYILDTAPQEEGFFPCFTPALWLDIPTGVDNRVRSGTFAYQLSS